MVTTVTFSTPGTGSWNVPGGVTNLRLSAWGGGADGGKAGNAGGAYAGTLPAGITVTPGQTIYYKVGGTSASQQSWVNINANSAPGSTSDGIFADGADTTTPGSAANCIGDVAYSGGVPSGDVGGGGAGSQGDASGQSGGPPDGGDGGGDGVNGTQPGGGAGTGADGGAGMIVIEYGDPPVDGLTAGDIVTGAPVLDAVTLSAKQNRAAVFDERIPEPFVVLVTITHPYLSSPIRAAHNSSDIVSRGETYLGGQFSLELPNRGEGQQNASIAIQNVDRRIGLAAQTLATPARVHFEVIDADEPDIVEWDYPPMKLSVTTGNPVQVSGDLSSLFSGRNQYPRLRASPRIAPGLYR